MSSCSLRSSWFILMFSQDNSNHTLLFKLLEHNICKSWFICHNSGDYSTHFRVQKLCQKRPAFWSWPCWLFAKHWNPQCAPEHGDWEDRFSINSSLSWWLPLGLSLASTKVFFNVLLIIFFWLLLMCCELNCVWTTINID